MNIKDLTKREYEVLKLIIKGKTNKEIADELCVSINTVKIHVRGILNKLNAKTRIKAAILGVKLQIA